MTDFREMQREYYEKEGYTEEDFREVQKTLKILRFGLDQRKENIVSRLDGIIVFVSPSYMGDTVRVDDVWLCSVERRATVYNAMPLMKITSSVLMGMSDDMREGISDALYKLHGAEYVRQFAVKYKDEVYRKAVAETNQKNDALVKELRGTISELKDQLDQSRFVIATKNANEEDEIELSSEVPLQVHPQVQTVQSAPVSQPAPIQEPPPYIGSQCVCPAPGMPEVRMTDRPFVGGNLATYRVTRVAQETLQSDSFIDGKYFVHINPSYKFLVIKKHDYGSAICTDHKIRLEGLGDCVPFEGTKKELMAEYSKRYDGMLVRL